LRLFTLLIAASTSRGDGTTIVPDPDRLIILGGIGLTNGRFLSSAILSVQDLRLAMRSFGGLI
jgi:hypothetical protein